MWADPRTCMLVPGADRLALGEHLITAFREASRRNNRPDLQRVPSSPGSNSMFAISEFTGLAVRSGILPARSVPHRETTGMRTVPAPWVRGRDR